MYPTVLLVARSVKTKGEFMKIKNLLKGSSQKAYIRNLFLYICAIFIPTASIMSLSLINATDSYFLSQIILGLFQIINFIFGIALIYKRVIYLRFHPILTLLVFTPLIGVFFPFYLCISDQKIEDHYRRGKVILNNSISDL